jgi:hypothetical protein
LGDDISPDEAFKFTETVGVSQTAPRIHSKSEKRAMHEKPQQEDVDKEDKRLKAEEDEYLRREEQQQQQKIAEEKRAKKEARFKQAQEKRAKTQDSLSLLEEGSYKNPQNRQEESSHSGDESKKGN